MAGKRHQFIIGLLIGRMREYGCHVMFVDGKPFTDWNPSIRVPPTILRHRPDILGITDIGQICIGEAKTAGDISSSRTWEEIEDYLTLELNGQSCAVFIGIEASGIDKFRRIAKQKGYLSSPNLHILCVHEEIINGK